MQVYTSVFGVVLLTLGLIISCGRQSPSFKEEAAVGVFPESLLDKTADAKKNNVFANEEYFAENSQKSQLNIKWEKEYFSQDFDILNLTEQKSISLFQNMGTSKVDKYTLADSSTSITESFYQNSEADGVLDIAIVVDDSGSMQEEQNNLSTKLEPLLSYIGNTDWRIGVTTTDPAKGCLRGSYISSSDSDHLDKFRTAVSAGTNGSGNERGILQAIRLLTDDCNEGNWLRPNSSVAVLIVSDEDNCQLGTRCAGDDKSSDALVNQLAQMRQVGVNARVYGLFWDPEEPKSSCSTAFSKASIYSKAVSDTNGVFGSICSNDYSATLSQISESISVFLKKQFTLKNTPISNTLVIKVNGLELSSGFSLVGNVISFDTPPSSGSHVEINYDYEGMVPTSSFVLSSNAEKDSIRVLVDGISSSSYSYSTSNNTINFESIPSGNLIEVSYRTEVEKLSEFPLSLDNDFNIISVKIGDKVLTKEEFTKRGTNLVLNIPPVYGAEISVLVDSILGIKKDFTLLPDTLIEKVLDLETEQPIAYSYKENILTVEAEISANAKIRAVYLNSIEKGLIKLNYETNVLEVVGENGLCENYKFQKIEGQKFLDINECEFSSGENISVFIEDRGFNTNKIEITLSQAEAINSGVKKVYANGKQIKDFSIEGTVLTVNEKIAVGAFIVIK